MARLTNLCCRQLNWSRYTFIDLTFMYKIASTVAVDKLSKSYYSKFCYFSKVVMSRKFRVLVEIVLGFNYSLNLPYTISKA